MLDVLRESARVCKGCERVGGGENTHSSSGCTYRPLFSISPRNNTTCGRIRRVARQALRTYTACASSATYAVESTVANACGSGSCASAMSSTCVWWSCSTVKSSQPGGLERDRRTFSCGRETGEGHRHPLRAQKNTPISPQTMRATQPQRNAATSGSGAKNTRRTSRRPSVLSLSAHLSRRTMCWWVFLARGGLVDRVQDGK
jgi:hypothetical protein